MPDQKHLLTGFKHKTQVFHYTTQQAEIPLQDNSTMLCKYSCLYKRWELGIQVAKIRDLAIKYHFITYLS